MKKAPLIYDKAMHEARKYWRDKLGSMSFGGYLALDHPRPKDGEPQLSTLEREFSEDVNALLQRLTAGNQFLSYTALVSALQICLYKYTGEPEVTIFSPATSEAAAANLLPIGGTLDADSSFKDVLLGTKDLLSGAYKNQQYPFSRMLPDLPDERRPKHLSMIASMAGLNEQIPDDRYDILILFAVTKDNAKATFHFDSRLYDESTVRHFFDSLSSILRQGLSEMTARIADLKPDYAGTSATPSVTENAELEDLRLDRLIAAQAAKQPESVAVVEGGRATTYKTLELEAERLAETLVALKFDAQKPVVILMDAGTEMIASMLAVMKAGAAFAPVKLLSGGGENHEILRAFDPECIICMPEHVADLQQFRDSLTGTRHCITVEYPASSNNNNGNAPSLEIRQNQSIFPTLADTGAGDDVKSNGRDDLFGAACVITSGSNGGRDGDASGSAVTHTELVNLFRWLNERGGIGADDRCLLLPGLGVCEQLYDTLGMLLAGAGVEIADASSLKDASVLAEQLMAPQITVWDLPVPLMQNLLPGILALSAGQVALKGPRNIFLSGEKQSANLADKLKQVFPGARVTGLYSNPAVGIWSTVFPFDQSEPGGAAVAESIPGFAHSILNKNGELAPLHAKGELHLKGLLSSPQVVNTGLRAEPLEGGRFSWLRGEDHCFVKYGCGVELTKVERVLCEHEQILAAEVITVKADHDDDCLVVAFIIAEPEKVSAESARDFLVLRDGVDLVPDRFILVDEFPLTPEGGIDRDVLIGRFVTLREPKDDIRSVEAEDIHRRLKIIWLEVLQVDDVGDDESFFARGGNSLKATLLIARIIDEFSVDLSVQNFFRKPTTRAVAQLIAAESKNAGNRQKGPDFKAVSREKYRVQLSEMES